MEEYFKKEVDDRIINKSFNFDLIKGILSDAQLFTENELKHLIVLQETFKTNISRLSEEVKIIILMERGNTFYFIFPF